MQFHKPQAIPALFVALSIIVFCSLGAWQLERLVKKTAMIAATNEAATKPALASLPEDITPYIYRNAILTGHFLYDHTMHLIGVQQGQSVGYYILTPFVLDDDGRVILVNRGWSVPGKEAKPEGTVNVQGILRPTRTKRLFAPENQPAKNVWFYEDLTLISSNINKPLLPLVLEATGQVEHGIFPIPNDGTIIFRNDHLAYAITWFGLAVIAVVMFGFYYRKKPS